MHKLLEQQMRFIQIFTEFLTTLFRVLTKQCQRAFVLASRVQLDVNFITLQ